MSELDLSGFDPKAPPPKTAAFYDIVNANRAPEDAELADALEVLSNARDLKGAPVPAVTLDNIIAATSDQSRVAADGGPIRDWDSFREWLKDRRNRRRIPHRMEEAGYVQVRNDGAEDGLWKISGHRQVVYARKELSPRDQIAAAERIVRVAARLRRP